MDLQMSSAVVSELAEAMIQVQKALQPATKDAQNTFTNSRYATLSSVMGTCRQALLAQGIWITQYPVPVEIGQLGLVTKMVHAETGQWQASLLVMPLSKKDPQGYGSAITYARRYALAALVGIVIENDDDAESATDRQGESLTHLNSHERAVSEPPKQDKRPAVSHSQWMMKLPRLDGVQYQKGKAYDGRPCVMATGETHARKEFLRQAGFRWDPSRKVWWRHCDAA